MRRHVAKGIVLTALTVLAASGPAAAFTPVPIPTPRSGTAAAIQIANGQQAARISGLLG
jgi:hypothetical protein